MSTVTLDSDTLSFGSLRVKLISFVVYQFDYVVECI